MRTGARVDATTSTNRVRMRVGTRGRTRVRAGGLQGAFGEAGVGEDGLLPILPALRMAGATSLA
eukprot:265661-Pleurochrysis_carterae.AAC.1